MDRNHVGLRSKSENTQRLVAFDFGVFAFDMCFFSPRPAGIWALRGDPRRSDIVLDLGVILPVVIFTGSAVGNGGPLGAIPSKQSRRPCQRVAGSQGPMECGLFPFCLAFHVMNRYT